MSRLCVPVLLIVVLLLSPALAADNLTSHSSPGQESADRAALEKTSEGIRAAFTRSDVAAILSYHHPEVVKGLSYGKLIHGGDALQADVTDTLQKFHLEWKENRVESLLIHGDTAIELTYFAIQGTPRNDGEPFLFKGRAMVVYFRYD